VQPESLGFAIEQREFPGGREFSGREGVFREGEGFELSADTQWRGVRGRPG